MLVTAQLKGAKVSGGLIAPVRAALISTGCSQKAKPLLGTPPASEQPNHVSSSAAFMFSAQGLAPAKGLSQALGEDFFKI